MAEKIDALVPVSRERQRPGDSTHENQDAVESSVIVFDILFVRYVPFVEVRPPDACISIHLSTVFVIGIFSHVIVVAYQHTRSQF